MKQNNSLEGYRKMSEHGKFIGFAGTYTKAGSEGVYTFTLDTKAKKL